MQSINAEKGQFSVLAIWNIIEELKIQSNDLFEYKIVLHEKCLNNKWFFITFLAGEGYEGQ